MLRRMGHFGKSTVNERTILISIWKENNAILVERLNRNVFAILLLKNGAIDHDEAKSILVLKGFGEGLDRGDGEFCSVGVGLLLIICGKFTRPTCAAYAVKSPLGDHRNGYGITIGVSLVNDALKIITRAILRGLRAEDVGILVAIIYAHTNSGITIVRITFDENDAVGDTILVCELIKLIETDGAGGRVVGEFLDDRRFFWTYAELSGSFIWESCPSMMLMLLMSVSLSTFLMPIFGSLPLDEEIDCDV